MQLGELLDADRIKLRLSADTMGEALALLLAGSEEDRLALGDVEAFLERLAAGEGGVLRRVSTSTLVANVRSTGEEGGARAALGVALHPLPMAAEGEDESQGPRIVVLIQAPRAAGIQAASLETLARVLRDPAVEARLLSASKPEEVLGFRRLMEVRLTEPITVEDVLVPMGYRVFPDTPLSEVVDLMARRGLQALPVVGEDLQVVGVVTAAEALKHALLRRTRGKKEEAAPSPIGTARDIMSRSVMCVSEDQDLLDAAQLMVNKDVAQLPVVRHGEIVGILTRDAILGALFGGR